MGKIMNFSYSKGKEPGVCIPRVIAVPYLKFHYEKVVLRNSPECAGLGSAPGKAELVGTRSVGSAVCSCLLGAVGLLVSPHNNPLSLAAVVQHLSLSPAEIDDKVKH